jgi:signal transduction histidine kinase
MSAPNTAAPAAGPTTSSAGRRPPRRLARLLRPPRRTVRLRLTMLYGGVFLLSGAVLLAITYLLVGQTTSGPNYSAGITANGAIVKGPSGNVSLGPPAAAALYPAPPKAPKASSQAPAPGGKSKPRAQLFLHGADARGGILAKSPGELELPGGGLETVDQARAQERKLQLLTLHEARAQARKLEALGRQQHSEEMHRLLLDLGIALAIVAILSLGLGWFLAGRLLRPLQTITKAVRAISAKSLHTRLGMRGPRDDLREVGDTFDELLERLERSFEAQRRFVANASHELRTPLTLERAIVEVALADPHASNETLRTTCERVLAIGEQQERLIDALLALARSERGLERGDPFDLSAPAREVVAARRPDITGRGLRLESDLEEACTYGDASLTERLIANLIDNAALYNVAAGWVSVTTATADGRAILTVSNSGPVVPQGDVERLFRPFQRTGTARVSHGEGHGLGLSIVSAIAAAHGADLQARARPDGGLRISVSFAAAASPAAVDVVADPATTAAYPVAAAAGGRAPRQ